MMEVVSGDHWSYKSCKAPVKSSPPTNQHPVFLQANVTKQYNFIPANGRWCHAAGKVTVGLASRWPRVTDISGSPPTGSRPRRGRWAPRLRSLAEHGRLYLTLPYDMLSYDHMIISYHIIWYASIFV